MIKRIRSFGVLQTGIVVGVLYAALGLVYTLFLIPAGIFGMLVGSRNLEGIAPFAAMMAMGIFLPLISGVCGFVLGAIGCLIYNVTARLTGGIEVELVDPPSASSPELPPTR